jgi:DNA mismatch endonuclease (patch repair protein)
MARIRSRGNRATELVLAALLRRHGLTGWRRQLEIRAPAAGRGRFRVRPDFVFRRQRVALFVDGCFWHGCPRHGTLPAGNRPFWRRKLAGNRTRDRRVNRALRRLGWRVVRVWEHALARPHQPRLARRLARALSAQPPMTN